MRNKINGLLNNATHDSAPEVRHVNNRLEGERPREPRVGHDELSHLERSPHFLVLWDWGRRTELHPPCPVARIVSLIDPAFVKRKIHGIKGGWRLRSVTRRVQHRMLDVTGRRRHPPLKRSTINKELSTFKCNFQLSNFQLHLIVDRCLLIVESFSLTFPLNRRIFPFNG